MCSRCLVARSLVDEFHQGLIAGIKRVTTRSELLSDGDVRELLLKVLLHLGQVRLKPVFVELFLVLVQIVEFALVDVHHALQLGDLAI